MSQGLADLAIPERLFVTERTVETHVEQVFDKLALEGCSTVNRPVLAVLACLRR